MLWHCDCVPDEPDDEYLPTSEDWARMVGSQRHDQYTPMGEIWMLGDFASGVRRASGMRKWLSAAMAMLLLVLMGGGILAAAWWLLTSLVDAL